MLQAMIRRDRNKIVTVQIWMLLRHQEDLSKVASSRLRGRKRWSRSLQEVMLLALDYIKETPRQDKVQTFSWPPTKTLPYLQTQQNIWLQRSQQIKKIQWTTHWLKVIRNWVNPIQLSKVYLLQVRFRTLILLKQLQSQGILLFHK